MLARLFTAALLATAAVADLASIAASIKTIDADWGKVNATLLAFNGQLPTAVAIVPAVIQLQNDLKNSASTVNASAALPVDQASTLLIPIDSLILDARITLAMFRRLRQNFNTLFVQGIVKQGLQDTRKVHADFGNAVVSKLPAAFQARVRTSFAVVDSEFQYTTDAFSAPTIKDDFFTFGSSF